ncbi:hypothetical protein ACPOL_1277 [Acidisarcina polymorpha]|uniref:Uncharacterized protein n=1 Tax=Acidisarcina polymorpha TaxID=2211140 RepID=A0A2Z5FW68_9BACT|nr:hypothetical protein ACPOL_1277 [Acidisarcina polymorpha]
MFGGGHNAPSSLNTTTIQIRRRSTTIQANRFYGNAAGRLPFGRGYSESALE